jgi:hypothetical protein
MTTATEAPKDKGRADSAPAADAIVTERGKRFEEDQDASARTGRHEGPSTGSDADAEGTEAREEEGPTEEDRAAKRLRLSNVHHGHVLTHLRLLYKNTGEDGTVSRGELGELLELMEAAHSNPTPQPESGSVVHGTAGPGAPPDIHHTPFSHTERKRLPGQ